MNIICFNAIWFTLEFLKLLFVTIMFFKIRQTKKLYGAFFISLLALMLLSLLFDVSKFSMIYGIIAVILLTVNACERKKTGIILLSYCGICIIDIIFATACIVIFHLNVQMIELHPLLSIGLNSFSFILIIVTSLILSKKQSAYESFEIKKYLPVYLVGGMSLSLYLTAIQFMGLGTKPVTYRSGLVLGLTLSSLVLIILCVLLIINSNENEHLKQEADINSRLLEVQKEYYTMLLQKENETKAFRHDIKKHIYCMNTLFNSRQYEELGKYLTDMEVGTAELSPAIQTGNDLITAIISDIAAKFPNVRLSWTGMIPDNPEISALDMCTLFYNVLSNAFEAAAQTKECRITVEVKFMESAMMVIITNSAKEKPQMLNGDYVSSKTGEGHGYGIKNIKKCIEKNSGSYSAVYDEGHFITEIILPHIL